MTLADYLAQAGRTPFAWGRHDCSLWLADWVRLRRGVDPAAHLRGRYASAAECDALLDAEGGLVALLTRCAEVAGLAPADPPIAGDVGAVRVLTRSGLAAAGGLCTGRHWAVLSEGGLFSFPATPLAAWRV